MRAEVPAWTASREEIWAHVATAVSPRTIGNCLLAAGLRSCVPLARLTLTLWHHQARLLWWRERIDWRVEWSYVAFCDDSRFYLYESDLRTRVRRRPGERHRPECFRPRHTGPTSGFMVWGGHQLHLAATKRALRGVQQLPWPAKSPDLSRIEHVLDMVKWELILSQEPAHNYCRIATTGTRCLGKSSAGWHSASLWLLHAKIHACVAARGGYTVYWCDCLGIHYCNMCV